MIPMVPILFALFLSAGSLLSAASTCQYFSDCEQNGQEHQDSRQSEVYLKSSCDYNKSRFHRQCFYEEVDDDKVKSNMSSSSKMEEHKREERHERYRAIRYERYDRAPPPIVISISYDDPHDQRKMSFKTKRRHEKMPAETLAKAVKEGLHLIAEVIGDRISDVIYNATKKIDWFVDHFGVLDEWENETLPPT